jgi:formamidopyrimidine-DNA glycosylase
VRGRRIAAVWVAEDPIVFERVAPASLRRVLLGRRVQAVRRLGKHLWLELDARPWPCVHLGMTGRLSAPGARSVQLMSDRAARPEAWPPRFVKLRHDFDDGGALAVADPRRLGRIRLRRDPRREPPLDRLGPDALLALPRPPVLLARLRGRTTPIKSLLLDQAFLAGVGNWTADEVLHAAGVDPRRPAATLAETEVRRLRAALRLVVRTAVRLGADRVRDPRAWLFHRRWHRDRQGKTARGQRIRYDVVAGRTTAWVPAVQR